jgi:4'-phosphopantetheinyl transferase
MLHFLTQSSAAHPDLFSARVPPGLLTPTEQTVFAGLKSEKRRHDWLLGRWAGKSLVQRVMGNHIPLNQIEILAADDGAPVVNLLVSGGHFPPLTLSISHSADRAFCGLADEAGVRLGVDLEKIEQRTDGFVRDYFVRREIALLETTPIPYRDTITTAIWSAKEAALKAIRLGLMADPFAVCCLPQGNGKEGWCSVEIEWDESKLKRSAPALTGRWRVEDGFVLTVANSST